MGVVIEICIKYPRGELECNPLACYTAVAPETGRALVSRWGWGVVLVLMCLRGAWSQNIKYRNAE